MSTIIKASNRTPSDHSRSRPSEATQLAQLVDQADSEHDWLSNEAARILATAKQEAEQIRRRAADEGRREGEAAAREAVLRQQTEQWASLEAAVAEAVEQVQQARQAWLGHWEKAAVHLAVAVAERVLRCKLPEHPEVPATLLREALELAAGNDRVRVCLHPADHATLGEQVEALARQFGKLGSVEVIADAAVSAGGCRVETQFGTIDQRFETQLARIEEELL